MDETVLRQKYSEADIAVFKENQKKVEAGEQLDRKSASEILTTIDAFSSIWKNSVISDTYEPGSTFKPFTVATSLAEDLYDGDEYFYCPGYYTVGKTKIGCSHEHDSISFSDIVAQSCNTALMQIGLKEGYETFTAYQKLFGFGQKTGIDLPGETDTSTLVYSPENMKDVDLATNSFGQNFNVSALQLITAFCSVVNGGYYYQPHVVKQIIGADGNVVKNIDKTLMRTTISNEVSERMREYLKETVLTGTGKTAAIEGYSIGGKTGTAEKYSPVVREDGKVVYIRNKTDYLVSFIACTPAENPEVVIYVTIDEPHVEFQANSGLATRLEKACMEDVVKILGIKKTETTATAE
jgi:stage V sporulation protein D (sporulation-specific penicillin-binding protein)